MRKPLNYARVLVELSGWGLASLWKEGLTEVVLRKTPRHRAQAQYTEGIYFPVQKSQEAVKVWHPWSKPC